MNNYWTENEVALFDKGLSNEEIANITGRSHAAIRMKRSRLSQESQRKREYVEIEKKSKINSIKAMAKRLGVRLCGK